MEGHAQTSPGSPFVCTQVAAACTCMRACRRLWRACPGLPARMRARRLHSPPLHPRPHHTHCLLQAPECTVRVTVLPETSTEGHRVKLAAVMLNLQASVIAFDYGARANFGAALG